MPCVGNGVKGRPVVPVLARAVAATQGGSQVQQIFRVGEPHPLPVPCQELCPKVLASVKGGDWRAIGKRRARHRGSHSLAPPSAFNSIKQPNENINHCLTSLSRPAKRCRMPYLIIGGLIWIWQLLVNGLEKVRL